MIDGWIKKDRVLKKGVNLKKGVLNKRDKKVGSKGRRTKTRKGR
jgi:hypothetical protein